MLGLACWLAAAFLLHQLAGSVNGNPDCSFFYCSRNGDIDVFIIISLGENRPDPAEYSLQWYGDESVKPVLDMRISQGKIVNLATWAHIVNSDCVLSSDEMYAVMREVSNSSIEGTYVVQQVPNNDNIFKECVLTLPAVTSVPPCSSAGTTPQAARLGPSATAAVCSETSGFMISTIVLAILMIVGIVVVVIFVCRRRLGSTADEEKANVKTSNERNTDEKNVAEKNSNVENPGVENANVENADEKNVDEKNADEKNADEKNVDGKKADERNADVQNANDASRNATDGNRNAKDKNGKANDGNENENDETSERNPLLPEGDGEKSPFKEIKEKFDNLPLNGAYPPHLRSPTGKTKLKTTLDIEQGDAPHFNLKNASFCVPVKRSKAWKNLRIVRENGYAPWLVVWTETPAHPACTKGPVHPCPWWR